MLNKYERLLYNFIKEKRRTDKQVDTFFPPGDHEGIRRCIISDTLDALINKALIQRWGKCYYRTGLCPQVVCGSWRGFTYRDIRISIVDGRYEADRVHIYRNTVIGVVEEIDRAISDLDDRLRDKK